MSLCDHGPWSLRQEVHANYDDWVPSGDERALLIDLPSNMRPARREFDMFLVAGKAPVPAIAIGRCL